MHEKVPTSKRKLKKKKLEKTLRQINLWRYKIIFSFLSLVIKTSFYIGDKEIIYIRVNLLGAPEKKGMRKKII